MNLNKIDINLALNNRVENSTKFILDIKGVDLRELVYLINLLNRCQLVKISYDSRTPFSNERIQLTLKDLKHICDDTIEDLSEQINDMCSTYERNADKVSIKYQTGS